MLVTHDEAVAMHATRVIQLRDGAIISDEPNATPLDAAQARLPRSRGCRSLARHDLGITRIALHALEAGKLRSLLTMLGVIIGVASVVAVVAVGAGAQAQIAEQIRSLGANILMVYVTPSPAAGNRLLSEEDAKAIVNNIPQVQAASPYGWSNATIVRGNRNTSTVIWGTTSDYFAIRNWPLLAGRYFLPEEEFAAGKQVIISAGLAEQLFADEDPVGAEVRVENLPVQIIGVLAPKGPMGSGRTLDDDIFAPISTVNRRIRAASTRCDGCGGVHPRKGRLGRHLEPARAARSKRSSINGLAVIRAARRASASVIPQLRWWCSRARRAPSPY